MTDGARQHRIRIERATVAKVDGEGIETWAPLTEAFARIQYGTGRERREAAQEVAVLPATFWILDTPKTRAVTPKDRIVFQGTWDIIENSPAGGLNRERRLTAIKRADV